MDNCVCVNYFDIGELVLGEWSSNNLFLCMSSIVSSTTLANTRIKLNLPG